LNNNNNMNNTNNNEINKNNSIDLFDWGLTDSFHELYKSNHSDLHLGRVIFESKNLYKIVAEEGELIGEIKGLINLHATGREDFPAVGDWVVMDRGSNKTGNAIIMDILERKSMIKRRVAGNRLDTQIIASNVDYIFICIALNGDFNLRRLERYLSIVWDSMATPVVILTKADLCDDVDEKISEVESIALGVDIHATSAINDIGTEIINSYLGSGKTGTFIGSSGVGKSTLINNLIGHQHLETNGLRNDDKGRHTTTHRELLSLPGGGVVIDTPGMRAIQVLDIDESINHAFEDVEALMLQCKFSDCNHHTEPGCAIKRALKTGELSESRYANYLQLKKETEYLRRKMDKKAAGEYSQHFVKQTISRRKAKKFFKNAK